LGRPAPKRRNSTKGVLPIVAVTSANTLELPEPLLEAVVIASGEIIRLLDDTVAFDAAAEGAELTVEPLDLGRAEARQLLETEEAERVESVREFRADALDPGQIVARHAFAVERSADRRAEDVAGNVARRGGRFSRKTAPFGRPFLDHVRAHWRAVGQPHALPWA